MPESDMPAPQCCGYQARAVGELAALLREHDVDVLIYVRLNAISRGTGSPKPALRAAVRDAGIDHRQVPEISSPDDNRGPSHWGFPSARDKVPRIAVCCSTAPPTHYASRRVRPG